MLFWMLLRDDSRSGFTPLALCDENESAYSVSNYETFSDESTGETKQIFGIESLEKTPCLRSGVEIENPFLSLHESKSITSVKTGIEGNSVLKHRSDHEKNAQD